MDSKMPPLPEPNHRGPNGTGSYFDSFTADRVLAYGAECRRLALESMKFHPSASHVEPRYRDWFNATIEAELRALSTGGREG